MSELIAWRPLFMCMPDTLALEVFGHAVARVDRARDGPGQVVTINLHLDYARRTTALVATRTLAIKFSERWARAQQARLQAELSAMFGQPRKARGLRAR